MKQLLTYLLAIIALTTAGTAHALNAAQQFARAPREAIPLLKHNTRLEMIYYFADSLSTPSKNNMGGKSRITSMTDNQITISMSENATLQLALVPAGSDTIAVVIETVKTPIPDSTVRLYRASDWSELDAPQMPGIDAFAIGACRKDLRTAELPPFLFMSVTFDPATDYFTFENNTAQYYVESDTPPAISMLMPRLLMRLKGNKFVEVK